MYRQQLIYIFFLALICTLVPSRIYGQLQWASKEIEVRVSATDSQATGIFEFKNVGKSQIKIVSVVSSCGCTTGTLNKYVFEPGDQSEVRETFNLGERTGKQRESVLVGSTDSSHPMTVLTLQVDIPESLHIQPAFLNWWPGEKLAPKTVDISVPAESSAADFVFQCSDPKLGVKRETISKGEWRITVIPYDNGKRVNATLTLTPMPEAPGGKDRQIYIRVR
jgi:hypothetical protein